MQAADLGRTRQILMTPPFTWGSRVGQRAAEHPVPGLLQHQRHPRHLDQPDEGRGRHTIKTGFYNTHSYKAQQRRRLRVRHLNFAQRPRTNPLDTSFGFANAAIGIFSSFSQASSTSKALRLQQHRGLHPGQLEGQPQADARLRRAVRAPAAAVRQARPGVEFLPGQVDASARRRCCTSPGCANGVYPVHGHEPAGDESGDRPVPRAEHRRSAIGTIVPEHRQPDQRPVPAGPGHREDDLHVADARRRAALRLALRRDRQAALRRCAAAAACSSTGRAATRSTRRSRNPPTLKNVTVRYGQLQTLGTAAYDRRRRRR